MGRGGSVTGVFVFKAAVVGAGTMGGEIAHVIASAEIPVVLKDVEERFVEVGLEKARSLSQESAKLITGATDYSGFGDVDLVIEAVPERIELKQVVFSELDEVTPGHAILASNTSSLSITEMGEATTRPDRVVGFHFFYPASMMRLIEVVEGDDTSPETAQAAASFAQRIRKTPIRCAEAPGFVVNRILTSAVSELWRHQEEAEVDPQEIDKIVADSKAAQPDDTGGAHSGEPGRRAGALPVGPFYLADLLGLDTVLHVAEHLQRCFGERFYVHSGMRELVAAGKLGAKTGGGFYEHG
jgi:3-hydroxyacyl-CoA dehydrogenase